MADSRGGYHHRRAFPRHLRHQQLCGVALATFFLLYGTGPGFAHKTGFDQRPVKP